MLKLQVPQGKTLDGELIDVLKVTFVNEPGKLKLNKQ